MLDSLTLTALSSIVLTVPTLTVPGRTGPAVGSPAASTAEARTAFAGGVPATGPAVAGSLATVGAQEGGLPVGTRRSAKITMPNELPEALDFERRWSRRRVDNGFLEADAEHFGPVGMRLKEVDGKGNRVVVWDAGPIEWVRYLNEGELTDRAADQGVAELRTGIAYDLVISPKYRTLLVEDLEAARVTADAAVARAEAAIEEGEYFYMIKERAKSIVRSTFATPELLEYSLLEEPELLLQPLGRSFRMGEDRRWEDFFINPIGSAPMPAMSILAPVRHDEEQQQLEVHWVRALDWDQARPMIEDGLETIRRRLRDNEELPGLEELFELREEVRYVLDLETGLPLYAEKRAYIRIERDARVESVRFVRSGFDAPESLTGAWDTIPAVEPTEAEE